MPPALPILNARSMAGVRPVRGVLCLVHRLELDYPIGRAHFPQFVIKPVGRPGAYSVNRAGFFSVGPPVGPHAILRVPFHEIFQSMARRISWREGCATGRVSMLYPCGPSIALAAFMEALAS